MYHDVFLNVPWCGIHHRSFPVAQILTLPRTLVYMLLGRQTPSISEHILWDLLNGSNKGLFMGNIRENNDELYTDLWILMNCWKTIYLKLGFGLAFFLCQTEGSLYHGGWSPLFSNFLNQAANGMTAVFETACLTQMEWERLMRRLWQGRLMRRLCPMDRLRPLINHLEINSWWFPASHWPALPRPQKVMWKEFWPPSEQLAVAAPE